MCLHIYSFCLYDYTFQSAVLAPTICCIFLSSHNMTSCIVCVSLQPRHCVTVVVFIQICLPPSAEMRSHVLSKTFKHGAHIIMMMIWRRCGAATSYVPQSVCYRFLLLSLIFASSFFVVVVVHIIERTHPKCHITPSYLMWLGSCAHCTRI